MFDFFCMLGVKKQANVSSVAILKYFQKRNLSKMLRRLSPLRKQRKKLFVGISLNEILYET